MDNSYTSLESIENAQPQPTQQPKTYNSNGFKPYNKGQNSFNGNKKRFDGWRDTTIKTVDPTTLPLQPGNKVYTLYVDTRNQDISSEAHDKLFKLMVLLKSKGYHARVLLSGNCKLNDSIKEASINAEYYLPWGKFNEPKIQEGIYAREELPYQISKFLYGEGSYKDIPDVVRGMRASTVQSMMGKTCLIPSNFVILYTSCGTEEVTKDTKFDTFSGNNSTFAKIAKLLQIPVINLGNANWSNKFAKIVGGEVKTEQPKQTEVKVEEPHKVEVSQPTQEAQQPTQAQPDNNPLNEINLDEL